jgi:membrane associated rhomboid family serine protease
MRHSRRQTPLFARRWPSGHPTFTIVAIAALTGAFAAQWMLEWIDPGGTSDANWLTHWLALDGAALTSGGWWRPLTFGLLHAGALHLLANLLGLFFFGSEIEPVVGPRHTAAIFVLGNVLGGFANAFALPETPITGISAGVAALIAAYATTLPEIEIHARLFFVVPFRFRAKFAGLAVLLGGILCWAFAASSMVGPAAIVFGWLIGWSYVRVIGFGNPLWLQRKIYERRQRSQRLDWMSADQFVTEEVDPILEKIAHSGIASLTRKERKILERGRTKIVERTR